MTEAMAIAGDHATPPLVKCSVENRSLACASATKWPSAVWRRSEAMGEKGEKLARETPWFIRRRTRPRKVVLGSARY